MQTIEAYAEQNGLLVVEAENGTATAAGSHDWMSQTAQAGYEGSGYSRALPDIGARYEETETAVNTEFISPQLSWPIYNETADTYSVWVRGMAPDAAGDSLHVGLDGATPSTAADLTRFTDEWGWSRVTPAGDATVDLTSTGEHDLDAWMREDGLRVDRVLLVTDTNYIPSGFGPAESPFETITETVPGGLGTTSISYGYDALYRLTGATYSGAITATFAYEYDPVGNMTAFTETVDAQTTSVTRSFDGANRLEYAVDASGTTTYTFDANGNLIELLPPGATGTNPVGGVRYAYDQRNLMTGHETNPGGAGWVLQAEYVYDGAHDRLQQVDYTGATLITTTYTNDIFGLTQVLVADDGTNEVYNLFGLDLISQDSGSEVRTLLVDGLGSVRLEMVGAVVETTTTYKPYGEVLEQAGMSGTMYGFTGEQEDDATGLLYLRARYYDSSLKTFMSRDPWEGSGWQPATLNFYTFAQNNPALYVDPSGRCIVESSGEVRMEEYPYGTSGICGRSQEQAVPKIIEITGGTQIIIMPPGSVPELRNEELARTLGYLGALVDVGEACTAFADAMFIEIGDPIAYSLSVVDVGVAFAETYWGSGQTGRLELDPTLPPVYVLGQDFIVTASEAAGIPVLTISLMGFGGEFAGPPGVVVGETLGNAVDVSTSLTSSVYDVLRAEGIIPTYFAAGLYWDSTKPTRLPIPGMPQGQPISAVVVYQ